MGPSSVRRARPQPAPAPARALPYLPAACLALATVSLNVGLVLALRAVADIQGFFYERRVLALTHVLTLGWISLTITGVLYRYVPALTKRAVRWPWLARLQVTLFALGALGLVSHFWIGQLSGMVWSAGVLLASVALLLVCLLPPLARAPHYDATVIGIGSALLSFLGVATLGLLYAIDKVHPFLGGSVLTNIAAHAHLAALGWVSVAICAVSYRMVAAFVLPETVLPGPARRQVLSLAAVVPALVAALLRRSRLVLPLAVLTAASLLWYVALVLRLLRRRRLPIDWSMRHVQAALAHLVLATACGLAFVLGIDVGGAAGARLAVAYGVLALLGWVSNFILGMGARLTPGLAAVRLAAVQPAAGAGHPLQPLLAPPAQAVIFWCFNAGVVGIAASAVAAAPRVMAASLVLTLLATLLYARAVVGRVYALLASARRRAAPTQERGASPRGP